MNAIENLFIHTVVSGGFADDDAPSDALFFALIATLLVGCAGIAPLLFIPLETGSALRKKDSQAAETLSKFLSFAVGALLGDVFLHLLPEAYAGGGQFNACDCIDKISDHLIFLIHSPSSSLQKVMVHHTPALQSACG